METGAASTRWRTQPELPPPAAPALGAPSRTLYKGRRVGVLLSPATGYARRLCSLSSAGSSSKTKEEAGEEEEDEEEGGHAHR